MVRTFERAVGISALKKFPEWTDAMAALRATLEAAGIEFTDGAAPEVQLRKAGRMTPDQVRAARALLGWSRTKLGARSGTSIHVVRTFEETGRVAKLNGRAEQGEPLAAIRAALEAVGVEFNDGDGARVALRTPDR